MLVEEEMCTPEEIIATLMLRDYKRQCDLNTFIKQGMAMRQVPQLPPQQAEPKKDLKSTTERLLSSWFSKPANS